MMMMRDIIDFIIIIWTNMKKGTRAAGDATKWTPEQGWGLADYN